ncbi:FAD:protein FMN transferase [Curvibacter soli]|uniref:FAD:protein FMN transferase n=1 Tax=Curvibacter soli TaxID=3031331 RepID=UPI003AF15003
MRAPAMAGASFAQPGYAGAMAPRRADPAALHTLAGETMGTTWRVRLANPRLRPLEEARAIVEAALAAVVRQMSHWEPASDLSRYNRAPAGSWHLLAPGFFTVLDAALRWARASGGALDPTVAPLVALWGFGPHARTGGPRVPDARAIAAARAQVGHARLALRPADRAALQPGGAQLDFSGIAKGYAVDLAALALRDAGWSDCLVEVGGELRASGQRPDGLPWRVAVAAMPHNAAGAAPPLALRGQAIATSGDHWHAFEHAGERYAHTIDPRTGAPARHALAAVTVVHAECMHADALATVLTVLGPQEGAAFAEAYGVAALFCVRGPQGPVLTATTAFAALQPGNGS